VLLVDVWHPDLDEAGRALVREELECATPPRDADPRNSSATATVLLGPEKYYYCESLCKISCAQDRKKPKSSFFFFGRIAKIIITLSLFKFRG
jgi:hypothetical protein